MYKLLKNKGFTLVEILVVISILGLIVGLSVPAIMGAQRKAKAGACLSNLRQIGLATLAYASDNSFRFPDAGSGTSPAWATNLAAFLAVDAKKKNSIFVCPGCTKPVGEAGTGEVAITYGMHGGLMPKGQPSSNTLSSVVRSSEVILAADMCQDPGNKGWSPFSIENPPVFVSQSGSRGGSASLDTPISTATDADTGNNPWMRYRHAGRVNVVMCDGHAESIKKGEVLNANAIFGQ